MNSFSNVSGLYNHSEPFLPTPSPGTCSLLTGYDRYNITINTFQPCCSDVMPIGFEHVECICTGTGCQTCIAQHAEKFKLISAQCKASSAARHIKYPGMISILLVVLSLALQVSASATSISERDGAVANYQGPGRLIKTLGNIVARTNALLPRADVKVAQELLGGDSVLDCPPNGMTDLTSAVGAATSFVESLAGSPITIQPGFCQHKEVDQTLAQICNRGNLELEVTPEQAQAGFDLIGEYCTSKKASGTIQTPDRVLYAIYAKVGVNRGDISKRASGKTHKRCIDPSTKDVTGCEDTVCTPAISLNESGDCPNVGNDETDGCSYYCEIKAAKYYGVPVFYDDTSYCAGTDCYLEEGKSFTVEESVSVSFGLEGAGPLESVLSAGISFGIALSESTSVTEGFTFGDDKCGWWYKVPVMVHTCGSLSEYEPNFTGSDGGPLVCLTDAPFSRTVGNACSEVQAIAIDSENADVVVIPNWVVCGTREDLPIAENSPSWQATYGADRDTVHTC